MIFFSLNIPTLHKAVKMEAFEQLNDEIETNEQTKNFYGRCFAGIYV